MANRLLWKVPLADGQRTVTINYRDWASNNQTQCVLRAPCDGGDIEVTIAHAEAEVPMLFLRDVFIPEGVRGLPDPDFEMFYELSSNVNNGEPWRIPIPDVSEPAGVTEKPFTGGMFAGFAP